MTGARLCSRSPELSSVLSSKFNADSAILRKKNKKKTALKGETVALKLHVGAQMHSRLSRFSPLWALKLPLLSGCSCSPLTTSSLAPLPLDYFRCLCHKCRKNKKQRHPAGAQLWTTEVDRLALCHLYTLIVSCCGCDQGYFVSRITWRSGFPRICEAVELPGRQMDGQADHSLKGVTTQSVLQGNTHWRTASGRAESEHLKIKVEKNSKKKSTLQSVRRKFCNPQSSNCRETLLKTTHISLQKWKWFLVSLSSSTQAFC